MPGLPGKPGTTVMSDMTGKFEMLGIPGINGITIMADDRHDCKDKVTEIPEVSGTDTSRHVGKRDVHQTSRTYAELYLSLCLH